jgi:hypothetical protein
MWIMGGIHKDGSESIIFPLHKTGDLVECHYYRGVSLLNMVYKVLSDILFKRILPHAGKVIGSYQCGFQKDRSIVDQIFSLRQIMEKSIEHGVTLYHLFVDFKTA